MLVADVRLRPPRRRRHLHRRRRARRAVADRLLPARGGGHAPVDARALGGRRRRPRPSRTRPHGRARRRAVRGARGRAPRRLGIERRGRARASITGVAALGRRLAHHPPGRRVEPGTRRARRERGTVPRPRAARHRHHHRDHTGRPRAVHQPGGRRASSGDRSTTSSARSFVDYLDDDGIAAEPSRCTRRCSSIPTQPVATEFHVFDGDEWRWIEATWTNQLARAGGRAASSATSARSPTASGPPRSREAETRVLELILSGAPVPETLTMLVEALEDYVPDGVGSIRLLDAEQRHARVASPRPSLPAEYVRAVGELTTVEDIEAFLSATELHVIRDIAAEGSRPAITALCLAHGLRGLWSLPDPHARRQRVPRTPRLLPPHRARPEAGRARRARARPRPRRGRHRPRRAHQGARAPRAARHAHRPAQPRARRRTGSSTRSPGSRNGDDDVDGRGAVRRPRPLQAGERRPRPRDRRRAARRGEPAARARPSAARTPSPASAATSSSCCARTSTTRTRRSSWPSAPRTRSSSRSCSRAPR